MKLRKSETCFKIIPGLARRCIKDSKLQTSKAKTWLGSESEHCSKVGKSPHCRNVGGVPTTCYCSAADVDDGCHSDDCSVDVKIPSTDHSHDCTDRPYRSESS